MTYAEVWSRNLGLIFSHLEEDVCAVVYEEDERADAGEVGRPRHHHQQDRRHVVDEHLPANEKKETVS